MNVGVRRDVVIGDSINHRLRFLRSGGIVQVYERLAVYPLSQNGKIFTNFEDVEPGGLCRGLDLRNRVGGGVHPSSSQRLSVGSANAVDFPSGSHCRMTSARYSRTESDFMRCRDSLAKAMSN